MPTKKEIVELYEQCPHQWMTRNGINGYLFSSEKTGQELFIPAAGFRQEAALNDLNEYGFYWTASPCRRIGTTHLYLDSNCVMEDNWCTRDLGLSIRPVAERQ